LKWFGNSSKGDKNWFKSFFRMFKFATLKEIWKITTQFMIGFLLYFNYIYTLSATKCSNHFGQVLLNN
jgi:hypothetical protein